MRADVASSKSRVHPPAMRTATLAMAAIACIIVEAADQTRHGTGIESAFVLAAVGCVAVVVATAEVLRRCLPDFGATVRGRAPWVCGLVCVAMAVEAGCRAVADSPLLLDALLVTMFRDAVIALALFSHHEAAARSCAAIALFLVVFASASVATFWIQGLVVAFAIVGIWWLMGHHWLEIKPRLEASAHQPMPRLWLLTLTVTVCAIVLLVPVAGGRTHALDGFMPTSGGRRHDSPAARGGVGDGEALVSGRHNIRSFAPIEDAPFMTSHEPTIYDVFDDAYNEPVIQKKVDRAIGLAPQAPVRKEDHSAARSKRPGREFSLVRQPGMPDGRRIRDLNSQALFYVKGRLPLHLKVDSFDLFDGVAWQPERLTDSVPSLSIENVQGRPWLTIGRPHAYDFFGTPETHAIKVVGLDTNRIPAPSQLLGVHIDQVCQADFYRWAQPDVIRLDREQLPETLVVQLLSRCIDPRLVARQRPSFSGGPEECRQYGSDPRSLQVRALAESWVDGLPRGWLQIERVVERMRQEYVLDPAARISPHSTHAVAEFMLEAKRGPDYLFAAATAWSLRSLGYATRLVGGFHADPRRYDRRADHTPIFATDAHFWVEVHAGLDQWIPLEPSPGYRLLSPPLTAFEWAMKPIETVVRAMLAHPVIFAVVTAAVVLIFRSRVRIADICDDVFGRIWPGRDERESLVRLLAMIDRRCERTGLRRPAHATPSSWLAALSGHADPTTGRCRPQDIEAFITLADQVLYAPRIPDGRTDWAFYLAANVWSWRNLAAIRACRLRAASTARGVR